MSDFQKAVGADFVREYHRLQAAQAAAHQSGDPEAVDAADHDLAHFIRMSAAGRLQEYMASRQESA